MRPELRTRIRAWTRVHTFAVFAAVATAVHAAVVTRWDWFAASMVVVIAMQINTTLTVAALAVAVVLSAWPAVVVAGLAVLIKLLGMAVGWHARTTAPLDEKALADAVRALPRSVLHAIQPDGVSTVDTVTLLRAAAARAPERWPAAAALDRVAASSEGGLVLNTGWTVVAAEAALVVQHRPDQQSPIDLSVLAAFAAMLPHSRAQAAFARADMKLGAVSDIVGLPPSECGTVWAKASRHSGGEFLLRRIVLSVQKKHPTGELLTDEHWSQLTGKRGGR
ncbi:hypothetical protein SK854_05545 [Lentzea sp. BCCO 10_0061]|uniref:Uncharacterized protein n=1 Tax=Lentzea sokolovensis TaxID=3095429 RepID=A0ABU4UQ01_9PSEU|nr:hypothetical protein [Lentzea sp. BCCO 10_0061]MDX8141567.1 hypothetical protein [Lentzea sp. BCCO 10_0061]